MPLRSSQRPTISSRSITATALMSAVETPPSCRRKESSSSSCLAVTSVSARPLSDARISLHACRSASTARNEAAAGLLISWASPAASVPSATSDSRWRAAASMTRTVWNTPVIRCLPNGNHSPTRRLSSGEGRRNILQSAAARAVAVYPTALLPSAHARNPPAHWPGVLIVASTIVWRDSSILPSSRIHMKSADWPSRNTSSPAGIVTSSPATTRSASCASSRLPARNVARRSSVSVTSSPDTGGPG